MSNIEKAAKMYPIGSYYIPLDLDGVIMEDYKEGIEIKKAPHMYGSGNIDVNDVGYIFINNLNKWADVINPISNRLEEARRIIYGE